MVLNEYQKQGLKQLEIAMKRCEQEKIDMPFVLDFIIDYFTVKGFSVYYKQKKGSK